jgi:hypothetical protein
MVSSPKSVRILDTCVLPTQAKSHSRILFLETSGPLRQCILPWHLC